jgi:DNA-binding MarR family transcriptional regulator
VLNVETKVKEQDCQGRGIRQPAVLAWLRLARIVQYVDHASDDQLKAWGLNMAQFDVLAHVGAAEGLTQQELADKLLVTKGNVCQILNRMEQSGLITRCPEGRANYLYLTEAGRALFHQVVPEHEAQIAQLFSPLSEEEQVRLLALVHKLERALR